jgi:oxygen-independent coproporphyrinogen-3 oxidase
MEDFSMRKLAIYVHIPFCKSKCRYCDFPSFSGKDDLVKEYITCLCNEIHNYSEKCLGHTVSSIYLGGGTPSYIDEFYIEKIIKEIKNNYNILPDAENTIEINPGTINEDKLICYRENGINRISFGLQSTNDDILKYIGRIHTFDEFYRNYNLAREIGFTNISVDLIFGLPNQTLKIWEENLNKIISLNPEHVSGYSLKVEENTKFKEMYEKGELILPKEDEEREMYYMLKSKLKEAGYIHYEISNFAKPGYESRHNSAYWERQDYIGFGSSAASCFNEIRFSNETDIGKYIKMMKENKEGIVYREVLDEEEIQKEKIILGLRMIKGIDVNKATEDFDESKKERFLGKTAELSKLGLIKSEDRLVTLTDRGLDLANYVTVEYLKMFEKGVD